MGVDCTDKKAIRQQESKEIKTKNARRLKIKNAILRTYTRDDLTVQEVEVEVCLVSQIPSFQIVGLPEKAVKESRERVRAAILNSGFMFPVKKVLVNLTPADLPKHGGSFDLPIALAILMASDQIPYREVMSQAIWVGELRLNGNVAGHQLLGFVVQAYRNKKTIVLPSTMGLPEALQGVSLYQVENLRQAADLFVSDGQKPFSNPRIIKDREDLSRVDFSMVTGRVWEKVACIIAAAGGHHLLFQGPPGVGKTLMAQCFSGILPNLSQDEMLEVALIYSWLGESRLSHLRPLRSPHHHITPAGLLGGGSPLMPGEVSLSHQGVLFLDEITEYAKGLLDQLREALVSREVHISRVNKKMTLKTKFQLLVAMNPCPCGFYGDDDKCMCGHLEVKKHQRSISTPFLDRLDMHILFDQDERKGGHELAKISGKMYDKYAGMNASKAIKSAIIEIRERQIDRQGVLNCDLSWQGCQAMAEVARASDEEFAALEKSMGLQGRKWQKTMTVARSIGDCEGASVMNASHLRLAHGYAGQTCVV